MSGRKVALLLADDENRAHLLARSSDDEWNDCDLSFRSSTKDGLRAKLALIAHDGSVQFMAGLEGTRPADDIRRTCHLRSVIRLARPLPMRLLEAPLHPTQRGPFARGGTFTDKAATDVLRVLLDHQPALSPMVDMMLAQRHLQLPPDRFTQVAQERDACATLSPLLACSFPMGCSRMAK